MTDQTTNDRQKALEWFNRANWDERVPEIKTIRAALTAPPPVADLEALKQEIRGVAYPDGCGGISDQQYIRDFMMLDRIFNHLHATGCLNTTEQSEKIKALKAAVLDLNDIARIVSTCGLSKSVTRRDIIFVNETLEKHAATIEASKGE